MSFRKLPSIAFLALAACAAPRQSPPPDLADPVADVSVAADIPDPADVAVTAAPCRAGIAAPAWWHRAVGYEVFVRSFQDSDGDGIGDFKGLTQRLDHLNDGKPGQGSDLEVDLLWLMPMHDSPSYHGYDVTDYRAVEPDYGSEAEFQSLLAAAHARGMKVIVDLVVNHTSAQHPWFKASAAGTGHADWYVWRDTAADWKQPWGKSPVWHANGKRWYYAVFWQGMPDLDVRTPAVTAEMHAVAKHWLDRGVDGFRLDAVRYLIETGPGAGQADTPETLAWWREFSKSVGQVRPDALLVGEAWTANAVVANYHGKQGADLGMTFDFDLSAALLKAVPGGVPDLVQKTVCGQDAAFGADAARGTFLTNHDMVRAATQLEGPAGDGDLRLATALLFALPGTPFLYYGDEIGLPNGPGNDDIDKRQPMPWDTGPQAGFTTGKPWAALAAGHATRNVANQGADPQSLLTLHRKLVRLRKSAPALAIGSMRLLPQGPEGTWAFVRQQGTERVLVVANLGDGPAAMPAWTAAELGGATAAAVDLLEKTSVLVEAGRPLVGSVAARTVRFVGL